MKNLYANTATATSNIQHFTLSGAEVPKSDIRHSTSDIAPAHNFSAINLLRLPALKLLLILALMAGESSVGWGQTNPGVPFDLSTGSWTFTGWNVGAGAGKYPINGATGSDATTGVVTGAANANMMFWNTGISDPAVNTSPSGDYLAAYTSGLVGFNGNGINGFKIDNTGGAGWGAAVLSIKTTGRSAIQVSWTARTVASGGRQYAIRLQYRVGNSGTFLDANATLANIEYASSTTGNSVAMAAITLPIAAEGNPLVQLLWRSYYVGPSTGTRPVMGVDDITVSSSVAAPTITSAGTGNWSAGGTWVGGVVPTAADNVVIALGHTVTFDAAANRNSGTTTTVNAGGTLLATAAYTNNGTTTINGTFQVNGGGYASGTAFVYAATGSALIMNHNSGLYGISAGQAFWPTTNPPYNVTIQGTGVQLNMAVGAIPIGGTLTLNSQLDAVTAITVNGNLQLNGGGYISTNAPVYGTSSTLVYNTTYGIGTEWTGNSTTAGSGVPKNVTIQNSAVVTMPTANRGLAGDINITAGTLALNATSGDLYVAGNWTRDAASTFTPNSRAVFFNGSTTQNLTVTGGGTATFNYLLVQGSGTLKLATGTNLVVNASSGLNLSSSNATSTIDLNGQTVTLSGGGNLSLNTGTRLITSSVPGGIFKITTATTTVTGGGTLSFAATNTTVQLANGFDPGTGFTTINGTLQIDANGFISTNSPKYGSSSILKYNSGTVPYGRGLEWTAGSGTIGTTAGYPNDVQVSSNTTLDAPNTASGAFSTAMGMARDLTIDAGSSLYMDYGGSGNKSGSLTVRRHAAISGNLSLGNAVGGDMNVAGNWSRTGTFTPNGRAVAFNGASAQTLTGITTFDYLTLNNSTGLTLQPSSAITVNNNLTLTSGKLTLGANNLTLASAATITSSATNYIVTNNTGLLKRNVVGNTATLFPIGLNATNYTPVTLTNTTGTSDLSVNVGSTITNAVTTSTKIVNLQWSVTSSGATTATITPVWVAANQAASFTNTGTGELGNYTTAYTTYPVTLATTTTTATGVAMQNGVNLIVVGNTGAVYTPPPANDNCAGAIAVTFDAAAITGNVAGATLSIAASPCAGTSDDDVWYSFTTAAAGSYTITVVGSASFDAVVDLRSGACNGANVACKDATVSGGTETITSSLAASTTYYVRVYSWGSSVPATTTFTIGIASPPAALSANGTTTLTYTNQAPLTNSTSQLFNLSGSNLTGGSGNITVTAPSTDFQVSNNNTTWGASTTIAYSSATLAATPVYVRFTPQLSGAKTGNITFSGGGAVSPPTIALSGTGVLPTPVAAAATNIATISFDANWGAVTGASSGYLLDVSQYASFGTTSPVLSEGFESATFAPTGWITTGWTRSTTSGDYLNGVAAAICGSNTGTLATSAISNPTSMTFYLGRSSNATSKTLTVEISTTSQSSGFVTVATYDHSNVPVSSYNQYSIDLSSYSAYSSVYIRFNKSSSTTSPWRLDDVVINGNLPSFVSGYNAKPIAGQSTITSSVIGLSSNTNYYYRLRATDGIPSAYSNVIAVLTTPAAYAVTGSGSYCQGSGGLPVGVANSQTGVTYTITPGGFTVAGLTGSAVTFGNKLANNYTVSGTNAGGTTAMTGNAVISENSRPTSAVSGGGTVCNGSTLPDVSIALTGTGPWNLTYTDGTTPTAVTGISTNPYIISAATAGTYTVTALSDANCTAQASDRTGSATVTVNARPTSVVSGGGSICSGSALPDVTITLTGTGPWNLTYTDGTTPATVTGTSTNPYVITGATAGTYTVTALSDANCTAQAGDRTGSATVTVNALPATPTASVTVQPTCAIPTGTIVISDPIGGTYEYQLDAGGFQASATFTLVSIGDHTVNARLQASPTCISSPSSTLTVNAIPANPTAPVVGAITQPTCSIATGSVELSGLPASGSWTVTGSPSGSLTSSGTTGTVTGLTAGQTHTFTVTNSDGCISSASGNVVVAAQPFPTAYAGPDYAVISPATQNISLATATNYVSVSWAKTSGAGDGTLNNYTILNPTFTPTHDGPANFTLTVTGYPGCGTATDITTIIVVSTNPVVWSGSTSNDWSDATNWAYGAVPLAENNVSIPNPSTNYPTINASGPVVQCKNITMMAGASLIDNGKLTISGQITYSQPARSANRWQFISSPVNGAVSSMFTGDYLYNFNNATDNYTPILSTSTALSPMKGYGLYLKAGFNYSYTGSLNKDASYSITASVAGSGWNLVGNPYPSAIDWDASSGWDKSGIANAVYIYKGGGSLTPTWSSYVDNANVNGGSRYIAPTQGFFVKGNGGPFSMDNRVRVHNGIPFYKNSEGMVPNLVRLEVSGNGYKDEAVVRFKPEATTEFDGDYDAYKRYGDVAEVAQLYTLGSIPLSINSLPEAALVPVGLKVGVNGSYTIAATEINDLRYITLEDTETGIFTDLTSGPYTFEAVAGTFDQRFKLLFSMLGVNESKKADPAIYSYQHTVHINMKDQLKGDIYIYNIAGQQVASRLSAQGMNEIKLPYTGNYIVKVISKNSTVVRKVFIQQ